MSKMQDAFEEWYDETRESLDLSVAFEAGYQAAIAAVKEGIPTMAKLLNKRAADACNVDADDSWKVYGNEYIDDVTTMLNSVTED